VNDTRKPPGSYPAIWIRALRPWTVAVVAFPTTLGIVFADVAGREGRLKAALVLVSAVLLQFGANMVNHFFAFGSSGPDIGRTDIGVFGPGRSRIDWLVFLSGIGCFFLAIPFGMILVYLDGVPILLLGIVGFATAYFYSAEPVNYKRRGFAVPAAFLFLGLCMVAGSTYAVLERLPGRALLISFPVGFLAAALLLEEELLGERRDRENGVGTLAVRLGPARGRLLFLVLVVLAYLWPAVLNAASRVPHQSGLPIYFIYAATPFAAASIRQLYRSPALVKRPIPWMLLHHYVFGILYIAANFSRGQR